MMKPLIAATIYLLLLSQILSGCGARSARNAPNPFERPDVSTSRKATDYLAQSAATGTPARPHLLHGVGVLGDSFYDEYQGSDNRGGDYHSVSFNLVELLVLNRDFNLGPWGKWGAPRREGFKYNWARSGSTSTTMIEMGQHTGLAELVRAGEVTFVFIGIGANDFGPYYHGGGNYREIYDGTMTDEALQAKIANAIADVTLAVDTVQEAGAQGVAVTLFTQWELDPLLPTLYPDAGGRKRVADAIDAVNAGIREMAAARGVAVVDQNAMGETLLPQLDDKGFLNVGGELIDFLHHGDEPHHARLADGQHLGTVVSGLAANYYFIDTLRQFFGVEVPPLTDAEILASAGLLDKSRGHFFYLPILNARQKIASQLRSQVHRPRWGAVSLRRLREASVSRTLLHFARGSAQWLHKHIVHRR